MSTHPKHLPAVHRAAAALLAIVTLVLNFQQADAARIRSLVIAMVNPKAITSFTITGQVSSVIDEPTHTITVLMPHGSNVTALSPTIGVSTGATVNPASGVPQDFTSPVLYTVTASDSSTQQYTVTVSIAADLTAPTLTGSVPLSGATGVTVGTNIELTFSEAVVAGTGAIEIRKVSDDSVLETIPVTDAKVSISGSTVTINPSTTLPRGTNCKVIIPAQALQDGSGNPSVAVTLTFRTNDLVIGEAYQGGKVAYILQSGDAGYDTNVQHGLIAASHEMTCSDVYGSATPDAADPSYSSELVTAFGDNFRWSTGESLDSTSPHYAYKPVSGTSTAFGTGAANTAAILAVYPKSVYKYTAAAMCDSYAVTDGSVTYNDWYLPSSDELNKLYLDKDTVGGYASQNYWSSSENSFNTAWNQFFYNGDRKNSYYKSDRNRVRAVRAF